MGYVTVIIRYHSTKWLHHRYMYAAKKIRGGLRQSFIFLAASDLRVRHPVKDFGAIFPPVLWLPHPFRRYLPPQVP